MELFGLWTLFRPVDVMTVAGFEDEVLELLREKDIPCQTYIRDVEELVAEDRERFRANRVWGAGAGSGEFNLTIYHDYYEVDKDTIVWFSPQSSS